MASIKPIDQASDKWVRRAQVAGPDYLNGVTNPRRPWDAACIEAKDNYKAGVTAAANAGRYESGVKKASPAKWSENAKRKGPGRYAEGVSIGRDEWNKGFAPFHSAIAALTLPPRGPTGSPQNIQRVATVANVLRGLKVKAG